MDLTIEATSKNATMDHRKGKVFVSVDGLPNVVLRLKMPVVKGRNTWASYVLSFGPRGGLKVKKYGGDPPPNIFDEDEV